MTYIKIRIKNSIKPTDKLYYGARLENFNFYYNKYYDFKITKYDITLFDNNDFKCVFLYKELKLNFWY